MSTGYPISIGPGITYPNGSAVGPSAGGGSTGVGMLPSIGTPRGGVLVLTRLQGDPRGAAAGVGDGANGGPGRRRRISRRIPDGTGSGRPMPLGSVFASGASHLTGTDLLHSAAPGAGHSVSAAASRSASRRRDRARSVGTRFDHLADVEVDLPAVAAAALLGADTPLVTGEVCGDIDVDVNGDVDGEGAGEGAAMGDRQGTGGAGPSSRHGSRVRRRRSRAARRHGGGVGVGVSGVGSGSGMGDSVSSAVDVAAAGGIAPGARTALSLPSIEMFDPASIAGRFIPTAPSTPAAGAAVAGAASASASSGLARPGSLPDGHGAGAALLGSPRSTHSHSTHMMGLYGYASAAGTRAPSVASSKRIRRTPGITTRSNPVSQSGSPTHAVSSLAIPHGPASMGAGMGSGGGGGSVGLSVAVSGGDGTGGGGAGMDDRGRYGEAPVSPPGIASVAAIAVAAGGGGMPMGRGTRPAPVASPYAGVARGPITAEQLAQTAAALARRSRSVSATPIPSPPGPSMQ